MDVAPPEDTCFFQKVATAFAREEMAPDADAWNERSILPVETLRKRAAFRARAAALAKRFAADVGSGVANHALPLRGGSGCLCDDGVERRLRDLKVRQIHEDTNEIVRVIVARGILGR